MLKARRHPPRSSRSAHPRRRQPLLPPSLLLLVASAFCWKGAAGQQIGCYNSYRNSYIRHSGSTENFFDALSGDGVDFARVRAPCICMDAFVSNDPPLPDTPTSLCAPFFFSFPLFPPSPLFINISEFISQKRIKTRAHRDYAGVYIGV